MKLKVLMLFSIILLSLVLSGCSGPGNGDHNSSVSHGTNDQGSSKLLPDWIRTGLTVYYNVYSEASKDGQKGNPIHSVLKYKVESVNGDTFAGSLMTTGTSSNATSLKTNWTFQDGSTDKYRFWINPDKSEASIKGPNGESYTSVASGPYDLNGITYQEATTLQAKANSNGTEYDIVYETGTGMILTRVIRSPAEETYMYLDRVTYE
ncbi:MAG TPA: hypothetical protein VK436_11480 [Methanocella sp.]|nr:hypothetical protein [Methanocella sp.]